MSKIQKLIQDTNGADPIPSAPKRPARINVHINATEDRKYIWGFAAVFAARRAVDYLIADRKVKWVDDNHLVIYNHLGETHVTTDCGDDGLSVIMEHEFSAKDRAWELPADYMRVGYNMFQPKITDSYVTPSDTPVKQEKPVRLITEKPARVAKERPGGLIALPDVISDLPIDAKQARTILRAISFPKPDHGQWAWQKSDVAAVHAKIKANLKLVKK